MRSLITAASMLLLLLADCSKQPAERSDASSTRAASPASSVGGGTPAADGEMCGGIAGIACKEGFHCATEAGQCFVADFAGVCKKKPDACTEQEEPVCGCNGTTYGNPCKAAAAGMNVEKAGACQ